MPSPNPPTRLQLRTDVLNIADAYGSPRWDATPAGEIDRRLGFVHAREWKRILQAAPYYNITQYTPTTDASGAVLLSALSSGAGDSAQQLYRILSVWNGSIYYAYADARRWLQSATVPMQAYVWYWNGTSIVMPGAPNTQFSGVWVNWRPQRFDLLAGDASIVVLPPDYDDVFSMEGAARLLMKGAAETDASAALKAEAAGMRQELLDDIHRLSIEPQTVQYGDSAMDWGG